MEIIIPVFAECNMLVAHNSKFDRTILLSELFRYQLFDSINIVKSLKDFCTCRSSVNITKIPFNSRQYKLPKLKELYKFLFNEEVKNLHNALHDTRATVKCFLEIFARGFIRFR
jgi:DNA polymerase III epsilon subunit-like protein